MHDVERLTWACVSRAMQAIDPDRWGWVIDAGLGRDDYYCEWATNLGYRSVAIEPDPTETAIRACETAQIPLIKAALSNQDGTATLYHAPTRDLRSLDGELWGGMAAANEVELVSLAYLTIRLEMMRITLLKLDIEGTEPEVLETLVDLPQHLLPDVLCFEWGGEGTMAEGRGPWRMSHLRQVRRCFESLSLLGYAQGLLIGSGEGLIMRQFTNQPAFLGGDNWGNAILTRAGIASAVLQEYALADEVTA